VTRRSLMAAGALAVLAGCAKEDEEPAAMPADALLPSRAAERAFGAAVSSRRIAVRSRERAGQIAAAISAAGGRPHDAPAPAGGGDAVELGRAALVAHVTVLPALEGRELRGLGAELVAGAAADVAVLEDELGEPAVDPFPGSIP
jgi:hypothetical protein